MSWSLASNANQKSGHINSLLKYVISNGSSMQPDETILSIHVIGTNLHKLPSNDLLLASEAYRVLINQFTKQLNEELVITIHLVDIIRCLLTGTALPTEYHSYLCSQQINQKKHDTVEAAQPCIQLNISTKEILAINGLSLFSSFSIEKLISAFIPAKFLDPFRSAVAHPSFPAYSKIDHSDLSILENGISNIDKLLCIDFGMATETVVECISCTSNALILMIGSLACNCTIEEMHTDAANACCATVISVHRRVTEMAVGTLYARNHLTNSTEILVFCINELLKNCKTEIVYVFANRFLSVLPTALSFLTFISSALYEALWGVAKEALQHALRLGDATSVKKQASTDSPDDPVAGVGDWLENILRAVPVLMDQQEDAINLQKATLFTISSSTLLSLCERSLSLLLFMGNTSNIWTSSSFNCFRDLCAASGGDHGYCGTEDISALLILLLEHSLDKGYLEKNYNEQLVNSLLYFPKDNESEIITSDPFCLKIIAVCVLGRQNVARIVSHVLRSIDAESRNGTPEPSTFWLLECISELLDIEDLKKSADYAMHMLYDVLKSGVKRPRVRYTLEAVHLLLVGGQSRGEKDVVMEKFRKCCCDFFDLKRAPRWNDALLTRSMFNFNHWDELHDLYINWLYDMQWDEEHLPAHIILPPTVSFLSKIVSGTAILSAERCHFIRIRPLLLNSIYAAYLDKFNDGITNIYVDYVLKVETLVTIGLPIIDDCSLIDLVNLPLIYYDSLLLFYNQLRKYRCSTEELIRITEFISGMYKNAINVICERSKVTLSLGACAVSLSLAKSDVLNSTVPHARGELHSILNDDLLKLVRAWAGLMLPELKFSCTPAMLDAISDTFKSPCSVVTKVQDIKKQMFAAFCSLCDNTTRFVLNQLLSRSCVRRQEETRLLLDWMIFIQSSDLTGTATRELNQSVLSKMNAVLVMSSHLARIVSTLLDGILAQQIATETNLLNGQSVFCSVLIHLISSQSSVNLPWNTLPEDIFSSVLSHIAMDDSLTKRSVPFVNLLSTICCLKNSHLNSRFLSPLEIHQNLLVHWVNVSAVPLETFCMLQPLIEYLAGDRHRKPNFVDPAFRNLLGQMINILFGENVHQRTADSSSIEVKRSDRWAYASLCCRKMNNQNEKDNSSSDQRCEQFKEMNIFSKCLLTLLNIGGPKIHCHLIQQCAKLFCNLVDVIRKDGLELLKGSSNVSSSQVTTVLYAFFFLCNILDYIDSLCRTLCPPSVIRDDSDDLFTVFTPKHIIKKTTSSRSRALPLCTFASTAKQFIQQHWYNCYTCGMVEGEGVCSVCAVNCHRGHDLSYSKFGSFFCDCGAKGCVALKSTSHPKPQRVSNQKYTTLPSNRLKSSKHRLSLFSHLLVMDEDKAEIENHLCQFMEVLTANRENIVSLITAVKEGVRLRSNKIRETRLNDVGAKLTQGLTISTDRVIMEPLTACPKTLFDKRTETGKSVDNIIASLEIGGTILLAAVQETSKIVLLGIRSLLSASMRDCDIPRVELDVAGFKIVALASMNDLLAVCGLNQCLILRISKDGDVSEKQNVEFTNAFPSYVVPKMRWINCNNNNMIAVAALQFIRIYDLNSANVPSTFEFVLPMGDVTELAFGKRNDGLIIIIVLSSAGHVYMEELEKARRADGASYFMTTTLQLPTTSSAISMHYSTEIRFLFVSMESNTYVLHFNGTEFEEAKSLPFDFPLMNWCECAGVFAALSHPSSACVVFLYPYGNTLYTQTKTLTDPATTQCMLLGSDCVSQFLIQILADQNIQLFRSCWLMEPDFWVKDVERSVLETEVKPCTIMEDEIPESDMVTVFEQCRPIQKLEFCSKALEQVYDTVELTKRITTSGMSAVCLKQKEFEVVVKNLDWNCVICALRIEVTPDKCPTSVTVFGKKINLQTKTPRMFDVRLTRKQSINCNNEVTLNFICNNVPAQIWSIKVFGKTKKDFGFPTASYRFNQIITLPEQLVASFISTCYRLHSCTKQKRMDWLLSVALNFTAPDFEHVTVNHRALILLRHLSPTTSSFLEQKDAALFSSLSNHRKAGTLQLSLFNAFATQLKVITLHRVTSFHQLIKKHFGGILPFLNICVDFIFSNDFAADAILEQFLISAFVYLAVNVENSAEITQLILEILFSDNIVIAHRCKCLMSSIISNYCIASVQNHSNLFSFIGAITPTTLTDKYTASAEGLHMGVVIQDAIGFKPAIIDELENQINKEKGIPVQLNPSSNLENFNRKMAWIGQLLLAFVSRLDICSCDGIRCLAPAQTILFLMGQHAPDQLTDLIDYLISGLDFSKVQTERTVKAERDQVILRLIYVILVQCTSHNWPSMNSRKIVDDGIQSVTIPKSAELTTILDTAADVSAVPPAGSVEDEDDAEGGGESDLEQMEDIELTGDISSSSRDATPQQDDTDMSAINNVPQVASQEHEGVSVTPEPQVSLAVKVAHTLESAGALNHCYILLQSLKTEWTKQMQSAEQTIQKLSSVPPELQPDLAPLFNARSLNVNPGNVFSIYTTLIVEMALRLPYQLKKILGDELLLDNKWENLLCDYITQEPSTMRRLARKLLLLMCGSDTAKYRQVRDEHIIHDLLANLKKRLKSRSSLEYFELSDIVSRINGIAVVSERRCVVWQRICLKELPWLMELACMMPDVACDAVLNLILLAIRTSEDSDDELLCCSLVNILLSKQKPCALFKRLITRFLLGENEERRWTLHAILRATLQLASRPNQLLLINYLYKHTWPYAHEMGNRAAQLVDLLSCYLPRFLSKDELITVYKEAVATINSALYTLEKSRSSVIFEKLCEFIGSPDISVLSKSPCLICSDSDHPMEQLKLSAIKLDSRFTTSAQMIKLMGHFEVSRIIIRLSEIKRTKMVKRFRFYYCNKILESAIDLKNRPELWEKAADVKVNQGDTEIDVQLPIPVVTCNVVLEMAEFYDTNTAGAADAPEFVHCPRCSTSVTPNPGICSNCGENVFQCVKCRAINYDEKEPFLCNSCGFCKYARLEAVLVGRSLPSVQAIEDDNDRKTTYALMETLLNDIESTRCHIGIIRAFLEKCSWDSEPNIRPNMILKHMTVQSFTSFMSSLNLKEDYTLATLYRSAEKLHNKLCEQTRQLAAFRAEILRYDIENGDETLSDKPRTSNFHSNSDRCVGCMSALIVHCVSLIQATCSDTNAMEEIIREDFVFSRLVNGCTLGDAVARSVHSLIWNLSEMSKEATQKMCELVENGALPCYLLTKSIFENKFRFWEQKLRCLMRMAVIGNGSTEMDLHVLAVFLKICSPCSTNLKNTFAVDSSGFSVDKVRNAGTFAGYLLPTREEQSKTVLNASQNIGLEDNHKESEQEEVEQNLVLDDTVLHKIMEDMKMLDEEEPDFDKLLIPSERFPTIGWLKGRFIWAEYTRLLQNDGPERERSILQYIRRCTESDPKRKFSLYQWLTRCMFSSVAAVRAATCRLLVMLCFEINNNGEAQIGSPVDIALVLQKVLLWMRKIRNVSADNIDEYFCLMRTLLTTREINNVLVSKPVELHVDIVKRILLASLDIRLHEVSRPSGDLSTGILLHHLIQVLNCMMQRDQNGWNLLHESSPIMLPLLLRTVCALKQVTIHRTFYVNESVKDLSMLLMRIALKRPILVLKEATRRIGAHPQELRIQAYLLSIINDIIYPLLKKEEDFLIQIEKDALQEDYLQGRMLGNPYRSSDAGMGPLMRDIKNKICRDCELVALLDDDTGMELLVNQQIVALDLPVNDVYEKLWRSDHHGQAMVIVYRMRGLLGDATEPFIKTLANTNVKEKVDDSQLRLASALGSPIRAFATILPILDNIELTGGGIILLRELHRLLTHCMKVEGNREQLNEYGGIRRFLHVFEVAYRSGIKEKSIEETIALQYLELSRILLVDVLATDRIEKSIGGASFEQTSWLLELSMGSDEELSASLLEAVTSIAPNLCLGNAESMDALVETFRPCCHWDEIDNDRKIRDRVVQKVEILCKITSAIHDSASGRILKKKMMDAGLITDACRYLAENHPPIFNVSVMGPEWKYFLSKPSLKYVLKLMAGMARSHKPSQEAIAENSLPILHRLEQISSAEHIGTLAENVMEELKKNDQVAVQIEKVRQETKIKKRQLAMAMRQKQLSKMGMEIGKKGQVKVSARKLINEPHSLESVSDISICCICREAMDASAKIMMVYAFASRLNLKENKVINGRNYSFTTVSQMNLVHLDCHSVAVRMAGSRSEWASAALHNANTKCNVIMPIWSKQVKDSDMEHSFQRLSTDLEVAVDCDTINLDSLTLDIAELLDRFVKFRSFSALSHGGGRESNMQYMAILILLVQYLKKVSPSSEPAEAHSFTHEISISLVMDTAEQWNDKRLDLLKSLQGSKKSWKDARHELLVWVAVDYYHNKILQCRTGDRTQHMRENIIKILENCSKFVSYFDSELSQCRSYGELMKAVGIDMGNVTLE
ncbi:E3 ubiquitin-protein ligase UBR4 family protein [Brugia pahangi]